MRLSALTVLAAISISLANPPARAGQNLAEGRAIAFDPLRGNCLACHQIADGESAGDLGPPLIGIKARYPLRARLFEQIDDPLRVNPQSRMPPYGRHRILTKDELDKVVDYIYSL